MPVGSIGFMIAMAAELPADSVDDILRVNGCRISSETCHGGGRLSRLHYQGIWLFSSFCRIGKTPKDAVKGLSTRIHSIEGERQVAQD